MKIEKLDKDFSVCKIQDISAADLSNKFVFLSKTDEEISLVCETQHVPENAIAVETGWKAFRVACQLDFGMLGVIAGISAILSQAGISIFAISTYNTDYVLLKSCDFDRGVALLGDNGYTV